MLSWRPAGRIALVTATALLSMTSVEAQNSVDGDWEGAIVALGQEIGIVVHFSTTEGALTGTIDVPMQGAAGLPLSELRYTHPRIHFEMLPGPRVGVFEGTVETDSVGGSFTQSGITGTFWLKPRVVEAAEDVEPERPLPYTEEEIRFDNGDVSLAGTLTVPEGPGPYPAVVMITGSGAQNRDEEIFGFKPFRQIADHLARNSIAVLRYDDRGVGGSTGNVQDATSDDFAGDALAGLRLLRSRARIDSKVVGLLGHSEGAIVASIAAARSPNVAFIVLLAGTAVTGEQILLEQGRLILQANGATPEQLETQRRTQIQIFAAVRTDEGWDSVRANLEQQVRESIERLPAEQRAAVSDIDAWVSARVEPQISGVRTPWFRFFLDYDPVTALERVTVPVLAIFGEKDLQVPPSVNLEPLAQALEAAGNSDYRIEVLPEANHLFLTAVTGSPSEYVALEKKFVDGFLELISSWIRERF